MEIESELKWHMSTSVRLCAPVSIVLTFLDGGKHGYLSFSKFAERDCCNPWEWANVD